MSNRRGPAAWLPAAALTLGAGCAFIAQLVAAVGVGADWAGAYDVMQGGCGWAGTCSDAGSLQVTLWTTAALVSAELLTGLLPWSARRLAVTIVAGCAALWLVVLQDSLVFYLAGERYPGAMGEQDQGQFFITWCPAILTGEIALAALLAARARRSRRRRGHCVPAAQADQHT